MANDQAKASTAGTQEHLHPIAPYPPPPAHYNGHYPPPPGAYAAQYYSFTPVPDGSHDPAAPNGAHSGAPFLMAYPPPPPGLVYAYPAPPGQGYTPFPPGMTAPQPPPRPKRKQVKMACTNCASACKRCDESRPCERCIKYGITDTCVDGVRKERKKGIKRGPYKRKNRSVGETAEAGEVSSETPAPTPAYPAPPEGYYPYFYPPPAYMQPPPPPHDPAHAESVSNGSGQPVLHPQFYPIHPIYAPSPYGPYPGAPVPYPPPAVGSVAAMSNPTARVELSQNEGAGEHGRGRKRNRPKNGDESASKAKKAKPAGPPTEPDATRGKDLHITGDGGPAFNGSANGTLNGSGPEVRTIVAT